MVVLVGYAYGAEQLYRITVFSSVALNSALLFTLLGFAILHARPDHGFMSTVTSTNLGGLLARRILPMALTLPFLLGWLRLQGQYAGLYDTELGLAIFTISNVLIFAVLVWLGSKSLNKVDAERQQAGEELLGANEQLRERARVLELAQVLVCDMDSRILEWNLGAERLYGFTKEEALGRISHQLFSTQFPEPLAQIEDRLHRSGRWLTLFRNWRGSPRPMVTFTGTISAGTSTREPRRSKWKVGVAKRARSARAAEGAGTVAGLNIHGRALRHGISATGRRRSLPIFFD
jgi:PAS domain S-box-containing protein